MHENVGELDRVARIGIGLAALVAGIAAATGYWTAGAVIGGVALVAGAVLLVTGTTRKCPLYEAAGIDTSE